MPTSALRRGIEERESTMLFLVGAIALALVALGTSWGTIGTVVILITATAWLTLAFRPVEAGALVTNLTRRRFE